VRGDLPHGSSARETSRQEMVNHGLGCTKGHTNLPGRFWLEQAHGRLNSVKHVAVAW
jgi:hypothetical protein